MDRDLIEATNDLLLGVDGGGSKTRALLADASGSLLGAGTAWWAHRLRDAPGAAS